MIEIISSSNAIVLSGAFFFILLHALKSWPIGPAIANLLISANKDLSKREAKTITTQLANRITGSAHNIIQIPFALYLLNNEVLRSDHFYSWTPESRVFASISVGYFLTDFYVCITKFHEEGLAYLMHAILCTGVFAFGALYDIFHYYAAAFILWEISTPFVHLRWLLYKVGYEKTKLYTINGLLMIFSFFGCRCLWGLYVSYDYWIESTKQMADPASSLISPFVMWVFRIANILLDFLNFIWFYKMVTKALYFLSGNMEKTCTKGE